MDALAAAEALCADLVEEMRALGWTLHDQVGDVSPEVAGKRLLIAPGRTHMHAATFSALSTPWHRVCAADELANGKATFAAAFQRTVSGADAVIPPSAAPVEGGVRLDFWTCVYKPARASGD